MRSEVTNGEAAGHPETDPVTNGEGAAAPSSERAHYEPWRRLVEIGGWVVLVAANTIGNSITVMMDVGRSGLDIDPWEPWVWEVSSAIMWLLIIRPVAWWLSRHPIHVDTWRRAWPWHLLGSVVVSIVHVLGMVALRKLAYVAMGDQYDFGRWPIELLYEYIKDIRTYGLIVAIIAVYRVWLLRMQGEASVLAAADDAPSVEQPERPERFLVRKLGREFLVAVGEIEWLQAAGNYVNLHVHGRDYPLRSTIAGVEAQLDPARFLRVHRSYIVNLDELQAIEPLDTGDARLHLRRGGTIPCSRRHRATLRDRVAGVREMPTGQAAAG